MNARTLLTTSLAVAVLATSVAAGKVKNLSGNDGISCCARVVTANQGQDVYVVWQDNVEGNLHLEIFLAKSTKKGKKFSQPMNLSNNSFSDSANPSIALDGDDVYVTWTYLGSGVGDIFFTGSTDGGDTFTTPVNLTNDFNPCYYPEVLVSNGIVYLFWEESNGSPTNVMMRRSLDGGATFEPELNLSNTAGRSGFPQIVIVGDVLHVVWEDESDGPTDVFYTRSTDAGVTFDTPIELSSGVSASANASLAVEGNDVVIAWDDFEFELGEILVRRSSDGGASFEDVANISQTEDGVSQRPHVAIDGGTVHIAWEDDVDGQVDIQHRRSLDSGASFQPRLNVSKKNKGTSARPFVAASNGKVLVAYVDDTKGELDVLVAKGKNGGQKFSKGARLSKKKKFGAAERPWIHIAEGKTPSKAGSAFVVFEWETVNTDNRDVFVTKR